MSASMNPGLPSGTKVVSTTDGEPGSVMNGFTYDHASGQWVEYEVETAYGIERWTRDQFVLLREIATDD